LERCWDAIHTAAKKANPKCIIWITSNNITSPETADSKMYQQVDWLMNERGGLKEIEKIKPMVGPHTRLITCLASWNGQDPTRVVPDALKAGVGLYGFTAPRKNSGLVPLDPIFAKPVAELKGDDRNIAVLARAYRGAAINTDWKNGEFVAPKVRPNAAGE
jgi:hypothetical protein